MFDVAHCLVTTLLVQFYLTQSLLRQFSFVFFFRALHKFFVRHWQLLLSSSHTGARSFFVLDPLFIWFTPLGHSIDALVPSFGVQSFLETPVHSLTILDWAVIFASLNVWLYLFGLLFIEESLVWGAWVHFLKVNRLLAVNFRVVALFL